MARPTKKQKTSPRFRNVALLPEDHDLLRSIASEEQRSMTRQLSVMIKREYANRWDGAKLEALSD